MKKMFLIATILIVGFMSAKNSDKTVNLLKLFKAYVYSWKSTCGVSHTTTFSGDWTAQEIAQWISDKNKAECGVRPKNVSVELSSDML